MKFKIEIPKKRNHFVPLARARKAGKHIRSNRKQSRESEKMNRD